MVQVLVEVKTSLDEFSEKAKKDPHIWIGLVILLAAISLIWLPYWRVSQFGINNATENATLENQYRATFAQILGGVAIGIGIYYTWRRVTIAENSLKHSQETLVANQEIAQKNLKVAQEGQITERFTRAIDQLGAIDHLGNPAIEIRLGGIYALGRIANESEKDYWSIMEIFTSYIRKNSPLEVENIAVEDGNNQKKLSLDIQSILTVIQKSEYPSNDQELNRLDLHRLDLHGTYLREAQLKGANLEAANLKEANLEYANLKYALLEGADLQAANLEIIRDFDDLFGLLENSNPVKVASLEEAILADANLRDADLEGVSLEGAILANTNLEGAILREVNLKKAILDGANLEGADLKGAKNLTIYQLSEVKTLYNANLDEELEIPLREKYPALFEEPKQ